MSYAYQLELGSDEHDTALVVGEFSEDEAATLNRFLDQYDDLVSSKVGREGVPCELTIQFESGQVDVSVNLPSRDELDILFQRLRLFMLQKERTSFVNVCSILRPHFTDLRLSELLKDQHAAFHNNTDQLSSVLVINKITINQEKMLMDWVYGYQYHGKDECRDRLRCLGIDVQSPTIRHRLVGLLLNKKGAVRNLAALIAVFLGRSPHLDIYGAMLKSADRDPIHG